MKTTIKNMLKQGVKIYAKPLDCRREKNQNGIFDKAENSPVKRIIKHAAITAYTLPTSAFASSSGSGLPWEDSLTSISDSISGPVLLAMSIVMFVVTILMAAFGEWGDGFQKILKVTAFLSLCFGVGSFIDIVFGGGAVM